MMTDFFIEPEKYSLLPLQEEEMPRRIQSGCATRLPGKSFSPVTEKSFPGAVIPSGTHQSSSPLCNPEKIDRTTMLAPIPASV
jgi:hypothetical protein